MLDTQSILTYAAEAFILFYVCVTMFDFAIGLIDTWQAVGKDKSDRTPQLPVVTSTAIEIALPSEPDPWTLPIDTQAIAQNQPQVSIKPQLRLLAPAPQKIATLKWLEQNMPMAEIYTVELPCAIAMAKSRMPKIAPVVEIASRQQLVALGIRKCKKLASQLGVRGYSNLKLSQLVERLEGKVLQSQLAA